jgi:glyoxylase-like metal-dependent hydrolase (beta-lactamase superfamily II)/rhodanese-related sulfurtransferase
MTSTTHPGGRTKAVGALRVVPFLHPQGCRTYLLADPASKQAAALDVHLDLVDEVAARVREEGWTLPYVIDSHTHADHPSGAGALAPRFGSTRIAHAAGEHVGVTRHPADGETIHVGDTPLTIRHAPGHTPDHIVLRTDRALFSGDTLLIGAVARTDFLGGDAGQLFDTLRALLADLPDETVLYPGHDYQGRAESTIGAERAGNPWLQISDRAAFVEQLTANPPTRPANMDDLLRLNREGVEIPEVVSAAETIERVRGGGAISVIDVRTGIEVESEHVAGAQHIPLEHLSARIEEVFATPAPRLLLCRTGNRAVMARKALAAQGVSGLSVVEGGIEAYRSAGGETVVGKARMSLERQVRVLAGAIILVASLLALLVHPGFAVVALLVSAGQVFAGLSDWCGMGLVLARMPWNRGSATDAAAAPAGGCAASAPGGCAATPPAPGGCAASPPPGG